MATPSQLAANTANAQHSTGPRTEEGKSRVAQNATKWGFNAQSACLSTENKEEYEAFLKNYTAEKRPTTIEEDFHVKTMADSMWRLNRARRLENELLEQSLGTNPFTDSDERLARELMKLNRYEKAIESTYYRAAAELKRLRKLKDETPSQPDLEYVPTETNPISPNSNPVKRMTDAEKALRL